MYTHIYIVVYVAAQKSEKPLSVQKHADNV